MKRRGFVKSGSMAMLGAMAVPSIMSSAHAANNTINVGVIGTGARGTGILNIFNELANFNVVACCDILPFRLKNALKLVGERAKGYDDYRRLLDNANIDAVLVATPFNTHSNIALEALDAHKHVYCEKTMAKGYKGIKNLVEKASNSKQTLQIGYQYHSSRLYSHIVELIKNGKIGKVAAVECQWNRNGDWRRKVPSLELERIINWRMYREYSGGLLAELCSHQLDFVNWVMDAVPLHVMGDGGIDYWKDGRETYDNIHMIYTYPNGVRAKFTCLTSNAKGDYLIKVIGDKGTITIDYTHAWFYPEKTEETKMEGNVDGVSGATVKWEEEKGIRIDVEHLDPTKQALVDFGDAILNNTTPESNVTSGAKGAICVQMGLDALHEKRIVPWKDGIV